VEANTRRTRATPCPRDADLRNSSHREGERTHLQNNNIVRGEGLRLNWMIVLSHNRYIIYG
jgi:hypothetical protein